MLQALVDGVFAIAVQVLIFVGLGYLWGFRSGRAKGLQEGRREWLEP